MCLRHEIATIMTDVDFGRYKKRIVQYFWDPQPENNLDPKSSIWCLGQEYKSVEEVSENYPDTITTRELQDQASSEKNALQSSQTTMISDFSEINSGQFLQQGKLEKVAQEGGWPPLFLDDFESRIWFTYRSNFTSILRSNDTKALSSMSFKERISQLVDQSGFTSDTGWGCMIRSGQSLLANTLVILRLGRAWRRSSFSQGEREILSLFADNPKAPFSIHQFVEYGATACGKHPGEWFGPSATALCIRALTASNKSSDLAVYVTGDGSNVYEDALMSIAKANRDTFKPTLILIGTRLGLDSVTPVYWDALKATLQMPQSIGIAGGRPSSSHYFVGVQGSYLFYLDPHQTRAALPLPDHLDDFSQDDINTCHTRRLRRIHMNEMDPSMLIAFLIKDEDDFKSWREAIQAIEGKAIIHIADNDPGLQDIGLIQREGAIDEVETFDDDVDEESDDGVVI